MNDNTNNIPHYLNTISQITGISKVTGWPKIHKDDLELDFNILKSSSISDEYLWVLKEGGTYLISIKKGATPSLVKGLNEKSHRWYHLINSCVKEITYDKALCLIEQLPLQNITTSDFPKVSELLDLNRHSAFSSTNLDTTTENWSDWLQWFESTKNYVMHSIMTKALICLKQTN